MDQYNTPIPQLGEVVGNLTMLTQRLLEQLRDHPNRELVLEAHRATCETFNVLSKFMQNELEIERAQARTSEDFARLAGATAGVQTAQEHMSDILAGLYADMRYRGLMGDAGRA